MLARNTYLQGGTRTDTLVEAVPEKSVIPQLNLVRCLPSMLRQGWQKEPNFAGQKKDSAAPRGSRCHPQVDSLQRQE
eukprot:scaffold69339_cov22-Tisochrysis_lutea.AAC.1